jgi:hypothetical protein
MDMMSVMKSVYGSDYGELPSQGLLVETLGEKKAKRVEVWHKKHYNVWDGRVHSGKTCPILVYTPKFAGTTFESAEFAEFAYDFYKAKHKEEDSCKCDKKLGEVPAAPAPASPPTPTPAPTPAPAPKTDDQKKAKDDLTEKFGGSDELKKQLAKFVEKYRGGDWKKLLKKFKH